MVDYDVYLNELLTRAHSMNQSFQNIMEEILVKTNSIPCEFQAGPIKNHDQCKREAQIEYKNNEFPKSAHVIDVIRCRAIFDTFEDLKHGLDHFLRCIEKRYHDQFEVMRVKNE